MAVCEVVEQAEVEAPAELETPPVVRGRGTKERLIMAAIALSGMRGFSNVPLREVVERAQCHNISAVHYHFKSRAGLLTAMLAAVDQAWKPMELTQGEEVGFLTVLDAWAKSLEELKQSSPWGDSVVKFLARLAMEDDPNAAAAFTAFLSARLKTACELVAAEEPEATGAALRLRLANACLLTLMMSARLNRNCLVALGAADDSDTDEAEAPVLADAADTLAGVEPIAGQLGQCWPGLADDSGHSEAQAALRPMHRAALI